MRLLSSRTLEFHEFYDDSIPPYAILSHTWGSDELSYEDMLKVQRLRAYAQNGSSIKERLPKWQAAGFATEEEFTAAKQLKQSRGYRKITETARLAYHEYFWVDTCCIQKSSSAELQEAINSMYRWYQRSASCLVYLEDVNISQNRDADRQVKNCRWITRGWTLQELIAPRNMSFYDKNWKMIGDKRRLQMPLSHATGIPRHVLATRDLSRVSVAQKMSWAATRTTTRVEDRAYSLLGIFNVHMAMLYGEGSNAFLRLQEEILRTTPDDSIFAWQAPELDYSICSGLLARSPSDFQHCGDIIQGEPIFTSMSNLGIRLDIEVSPYDGAGEHDPLYAGWLRSGTLNHRCYIILRPLLEDNYGVRCTRVMAQTPVAMPTQSLSVKSVIIRQEPHIPTGLVSAHSHSFHLGRSDQSALLADSVYHYSQRAEYRIVKAWPPRQYAADTRQLFIPKGTVKFTGVVFLEYYSQYLIQDDDAIQLLLGQDGPKPRVWCKFVRHTWPDMDAPEASWQEAIDSLGPFDGCGTCSVVKGMPFSGFETYSELTALIEMGLFRNRLSLRVSIDGIGDDPID